MALHYPLPPAKMLPTPPRPFIFPRFWLQGEVHLSESGETFSIFMLSSSPIREGGSFGGEGGVAEESSRGTFWSETLCWTLPSMHPVQAPLLCGQLGSESRNNLLQTLMGLNMPSWLLP